MNNKRYHIFCDESGIVKEDFMILGGVVFKSYLYAKLDTMINNLKLRNNKLTHEIKFEKLTNNQNYILYKDIIDIFINEEIDFRAMTICKKTINHAKYNANQKEKKHQNEQGFHKLYYTMLKNCMLLIEENALYSCYLDKCPSVSSENLSAQEKPDINTIKTCLNAPYLSSNPFQTLEWLDSNRSNFIQFADLLCGMLMFEKNERHLVQTNSNKYKIMLLQYIRKQLNKQSIGDTTLKHETKWKIFNKK